VRAGARAAESGLTSPTRSSKIRAFPHPETPMSRIPLLALAALAVGCGSPTQANRAGAPAADPKAPVAKYEGGTITAGELDELLKADLRKLENEHQQKTWELRKSGLDALVSKKLVERKAKAENVTPEELLKRDVVEKLPAPSDAEMKALYDQAAAQGQPLPPFEQIKPEIARYMQNERSQGALRAYYDKLRADAKVELLLPAYRPPRVAVAAEGPSKGPSDAKITIVEFSDFECPYCVKAEETVKQVLKKYEGKVRVVYRDFPLPFHEHAQKAAEAARCAGDQGKYWEMHEKLFANAKALEVPALKGYAKELGIDQGKFDKCLDDGGKAKLVADDRKAGEEAGVSGTPAFFVNGVLLSGAQPLEAFSQVIDEELKNPQVAKK
jgi:protein-disulfide isomerase